MKVRNWIGAAVLGIALAPLPAMAQDAKVDDGAIKTRVETRLKASPSLNKDDIKVEAVNGVVTLTGTVQSKAESARAAQLAKVAGVTRVENKLDVKTETAATTGRIAEKSERAMDKAGDKTDKAMDKAGDKTDKAMDKAGDKTDKAMDKTADAAKKAGAKTKDAGSDVGEAITDTWILTKVKADFVGEDALKGSDINVDVKNHIVTLKGTVPNAAAHARAVAIAKGTKGVTRVVDTLTMAPGK